jgi:polyisoprenoid-binding protein YceI
MKTYNIDTAHSEINFKVKHLMITNVTGKFTEFNATMQADKEDFSDAKITFSANVNSISTNNEQRDAHLKSNDFFNAEKFPTLHFESTSIAPKSADNFELTGNLTIRDITKTVVLNVEFGGKIVDPYGQTKLGFELAGKINRKDFGLTWSATTETGGIVVSDEVRLQLAVQMIQQ